jgi:apolipoprotein N-acyltransferase
MNLLTATGDWVGGLTGWRRYGFAFAAGALSALGFAPLELFPLLLLGFAVLLLLLDAAAGSVPPFVSLAMPPAPSPSGASHHRGGRLGTAFLIGWAFAFGQFLIGLHWIGYAFLIDPEAHLWQLPFAITLLPAGLALFIGLASTLAVFLWRYFPKAVSRLLVFAVVYAGFEWLRGHIFTGFPWNLAAYGWGASLAVQQSMALFGAYGLSFLTILLGASLAGFTRPKAWKSPVAMILLFAALWAGGAVRLASHPIETVQGVRLRIVQPDVPQREKELSRYYARNWQRLLDLSVSPGNPSVIIWPEAATPPFLFDREPAALDVVRQFTQGGRTLMTGATRVAREGDKLSFYNSLFMFPAGGGPAKVYDKFHLVPFGEYVPFANILNHIGVTKLTAGQEGFSFGDSPHTYQLAGLPAVTPLICYEIIFPNAVTPNQKGGGQRPGWFVNVTDDSWFGPWAGPYQHLIIARARAIEEALPVARAANTGISAVIDPYGRITGELGLGKMGVLDAGLPKAAEQSTYARYGDGMLLLLLLLTTSLAFVLRRN